MIELQAASARRGTVGFRDLSLEWGAGIHAIVGGPADGGPLLLEVLAGARRLRSGRVRLLGARPHDAEVRRQIAYVPRVPALPEGLRVSEVLEMAASIRGEPADARARLAALGEAVLADRRVESLSAEEAHAVALVEALTSARVRVILLEEPLLTLDPPAAGPLPSVLWARAAQGCAVLIATASLRDARELARSQTRLRYGSVVAADADPADLAQNGGARMKVVTADPGSLVAALARDSAVEAVARRDSVVVARGRDAVALAEATARAAVDSGVDVVEMRLEPLAREEIW